MVTKNYIRGVPQNAVLIPIGQTDGSIEYLRRDGVHVNGIAEPFTLYADDAGASPLPNDSYNLTSQDDEWTDRESIANGGTGKVIYSQFQVTDPTYQNVDLWASFQDFGTYTDNDAPYAMVGVQTTITASGTFYPSTGALVEMVTVDTSAGNISLTIGAPEFPGQSVDIICDGTGYVDVTFPGQESTAAVRVTNAKKLSLKGKSGGDWIADSGKTAVYTSGAFRVIQYSDGEMEQESSVDSQVTIAVNNFFGTSSGTVYYADSGLSYAVPFLAAPAVYSGQQDSIASHYYNKTTTTITLRVFGNSNGAFQKSFYVSRGRY